VSTIAMLGATGSHQIEATRSITSMDREQVLATIAIIMMATTRGMNPEVRSSTQPMVEERMGTITVRTMMDTVRTWMATARTGTDIIGSPL
jgi:hypothetical protein